MHIKIVYAVILAFRNFNLKSKTNVACIYVCVIKHPYFLEHEEDQGPGFVRDLQRGDGGDGCRGHGRAVQHARGEAVPLRRRASPPRPHRLRTDGTGRVL